MLNSSQAVDNFDSIEDNFVARLPSNEEDTFAILSFDDLDYCNSPCLDDNLMFSRSKLSQKVETMDHEMQRITGKTVEGEEYFLSGSALADLSPGVEFADIDTLLKNPQNPADFLNYDEVGLFLGGGLKDDQNLCAEVDSLGPLTTIESGEIDAAWLTSAFVVTPDQLKFTGTDANKDSWLVVNPAGQAEKILQEISIPSSVQDSYASNAEEELNTSLISVTDSSAEPSTSSSSKSRKRRRQSVDPDSEEYKKKRELNNISVRKSREKARHKQQETEGRVDILAAENNRLQERVDSLEKELTILRGLFSNIGASLPGEVTKFMAAE